MWIAGGTAKKITKRIINFILVIWGVVTLIKGAGPSIRTAPFAWPDWSITYPIGRRRCQTKEVHLNQRLATTNQRIDKEVLYP